MKQKKNDFVHAIDYQGIETFIVSFNGILLLLENEEKNDPTTIESKESRCKIQQYSDDGLTLQNLWKIFSEETRDECERAMRTVLLRESFDIRFKQIFYEDWIHVNNDLQPQADVYPQTKFACA